MADSAGPVLRDAEKPLLPFTERRSLRSKPTPSHDSLGAPSNASTDDFMSLMKNWSGTGTKFDVGFHSLTLFRKARLKMQKVLGREAYREVAQVTCQGVEVARKSIRIRGGIPKPQVDQLKKESEIGEMLNGHRHIIKLLWMHSQGIYLRDPKPQNLLLGPGELF